MKPFLTSLGGDLVSKTFLFLGFSFTDPNLEYILSRVRVRYGPHQRPHHAILRRVQRDADDSDSTFEYKVLKQQLFATELSRVGIRPTWVDEYSQITDILRAVENRFKRRTVFISGSAHIFGRWGKDDSEKFVAELSKDISKLDYRVVSGFGLGIGGPVITGVLEHVYMHGGRLDSDQLILRPFPQNHNGAIKREVLWAEYREDMISFAGIAVFVFGNKYEDGQVINAGGVRAEFEIAKKQGVFILPVGITGFMAEELWNEIMATFDEAKYKNGVKIKSALETLGSPNSTLDMARSAVIDAIKLLNG